MQAFSFISLLLLLCFLALIPFHSFIEVSGGESFSIAPHLTCKVNFDSKKINFLSCCFAMGKKSKMSV